MTLQEKISELETRADAVGVPMYLICEHSGVAPSTYYKWKKTDNATYASVAKVEASLVHYEKTHEKR